MAAQLRTIQRGEGCTGNLTFKTESGERAGRSTENSGVLGETNGNQG